MPESDRRRAGTRRANTKPDTTNESAADAVQRAQLHARRAIGEAIASLQALVDAASLGLGGRLARSPAGSPVGSKSEAQAALRGLSELLERQSRQFLDDTTAIPVPVMTAIVDALDHEIDRWEKRAARDPDARAVLRTFLGLREILWEFGFRRDDAASPGSSRRKPAGGRKRSKSAAAQNSASGSQTDSRTDAKADSKPESKPDSKPESKPGPKRRGRVQRVDVQG